MKHFFKKLRTQKGFVILFTVLISAIILMIGAGIFSIATREEVLSSTAREAQSAFYAADAGMECALFGQSQSQLMLLNGTFFCGDAPISVSGGPGTAASPFVFNVLITNSIIAQNSCAKVSAFFTDSTDATIRVIAQGYNVCTNVNGIVAPDTANPLLVERDLDSTFGLGGTSSVPLQVGP